MTFIPLNHRNFAINKVANSTKITYVHSDRSTHICDTFIDSKSLVNTNNFQGISLEEFNLNTTEDNLEAKKNLIKDFYSSVEDSNSSGSQIISLKENLINSGLTNHNIKEYNFRNFFGIERINQKFLPNSFELQKKNLVKNSLYYNYKRNYSLDFYKNINQGFCNYNTLNFFSQEIEEDRNTKHSNCVIWPNPKQSNDYLYDIYNKNFFLSAYVNLRKNYNIHRNPECFFHVPGLISIYFVKSINATNSDNETMHRIALSVGESANKKITEFNKNIFRVSSRSIDLEKGTYVSSDLDIFNNRWYNIGVNFSKNSDNSRNISIYIDGNEIDTFNIIFINEETYNQDSFICVGNKPDYLDRNSDVYKQSYDEIFYQFFGGKVSNDEPIDGPFYTKDISFGNNNTWVESGQYSIDDIITDNKFVTFESKETLNSESFHGEIHDIRIYGQLINDDKIKNILEETISSIQDEINNYNILFYVPCFYLPVYSRKKTNVNCNDISFNVKFSNLYNPYFANFCGGFEASTESYLLDFINLTKPNIVIGGKEEKNIHNDAVDASISSLVSTTRDVDQIKKGIYAVDIYNQNFEAEDQNSSIFEVNINSNLSYRNLMILPNDNGIPKVNFNIISEVLENIDYFDLSQIDLNNLYHIKTTDIFKKDEYQDNINLNNVLDDNSKFVDINISADEIFRFDVTSDRMFNVSNVIYHDSRIVDIQDLSVIDSVNFQSSLDKINSTVGFTKSNPVTRDYKQSPFNFNYNLVSVDSVEPTYLNDSSISYFKLPIPYSSVNINYDCLFTSIFDISSKLYNKKINKKSFLIKDDNIITSGGNLNISIKDDGYGQLYRANCLTKVADWNYLGHIFYSEGIISINRPELCYFGRNDFTCEFESDFNMYVQEINIPANSGYFNMSNNKTYNEELRVDESAFNSESSFVYVTDINLHDENLNIVAKAKLARPAPKKYEDNILFRLKMDY